MIELDIFERYQSLKRQRVFLELNGLISQDIIVGSVELIRKRLSQIPEDRKTIKKVAFVFVELVQNVVNHSAESIVVDGSDNRIGKGIVALIDDEDAYIIQSGNLLENVKIAPIESHCETINQLGREGLENLFKKQIKIPRQEGANGAGIGLIEIARKTKNRLEIRIKKIDSSHSFLMLSARLEKEERR
jgi:hypothetical protein